MLLTDVIYRRPFALTYTVLKDQQYILVTKFVEKNRTNS